jgi:hypothetical protein
LASRDFRGDHDGPDAREHGTHRVLSHGSNQASFTKNSGVAEVYASALLALLLWRENLCSIGM